MGEDIPAIPVPRYEDFIDERVPIGVWDFSRFRYVAMLQEAPRNKGRVELAEDQETGRLVAVKAMPAAWVCESHEAFVTAHPEENELPWRDISTTRYLHTVAGLSCVCEYIGTFRRQSEGDGEICMVLSYCAGGDLFSWLEQSLSNAGRTGATIDREAATQPLMRRVLEAIRDIHAQGIAHGDLSLENVLLTVAQDSQVEASLRVIDFGASTGLRASGMRGKPSYQAPEVHGEGEYDALAADAFSVGVMIFTLVVGNYPWRSTWPHVCPCFSFAADRGLLAYLGRRKVRRGPGEVVPLVSVLSQQVVSLLSGLLAIDASTRMTIAEALEHTWVRDGPGSNGSPDGEPA